LERLNYFKRRRDMGRYIKVMLAALLIVTGVCVFLPSSYVTAGGMVVNQSFEQGEEEAPYGWELSGNAARINTGPIYAGSWSALISDDGDTLTQWIENIESVLTYEVWGWIYVSGNVTGVITLDFWEGKEGRQLSSTRMLFTNNTNGAYVQKTDTMQAPPGTTHLRICLLGTGWNDGAEVRFDEIGFWPPGGGFWDRLRDSCFIATAAYGTETASQLDTLRDFRDQVLLENTLGALFVEAYYKVSPPVAAFIAKSDFLRAVVREMLLDPLVNLLRWSQDLWRAHPG
jgi:hypothetical protein